MRAAIKDLYIQVDRDFKHSFKFDYDISGLTFTASIYDLSGTKIIDFLIMKDNALKMIVLSLTDLQTKDLSGSLRYDVKQTTDSSNYDFSPIIGAINLSKVYS
jgi:hypothetical protein